MSRLKLIGVSGKALGIRSEARLAPSIETYVDDFPRSWPYLCIAGTKPTTRDTSDGRGIDGCYMKTGEQMHAETAAFDDGDTLKEAEIATSKEERCDASLRMGHSLLDALLPANPPEPKNARIIRLFDIEAAKNDPLPVAANEIQKAHHERKNRAEVRVQRNRSLLAAAGLE